MGVDRWFSLDGRVALVTGAARGLGRGYAEALAEAGALVICADLDGEGAATAAGELRSRGWEADAVEIDVADAAAVTERIQQAAVDHGNRLDILVNNAGVEIAEPFVDVSPEHFDTIVGVNLRGVFFASQAAARIMVQQNRGKIVNIGSLGSAIGLAGSTVYCATKGGVLQLTRAMAIELAPHGVQVNAIGPGYFRTPMTEPFFQDPDHRRWIEQRIPLGRVGSPADLAAMVVFLSGPGSDYITGQIFYVDGGWLAS